MATTVFHSYIPRAEKSSADGVATLDNNKKLPESQLSDVAIKSVNGEVADEHGAVQLDVIKAAEQIVAYDAQQTSGTYIIRTTGGEASLSS